MSYKKLQKRGSFLVEVLLTVVILSVSLTIIIQSLVSSLRAISYSANYSSAILSAENKMFELLQQAHLFLLLNNRLISSSKREKSKGLEA